MSASAPSAAAPPANARSSAAAGPVFHPTRVGGTIGVFVALLCLTLLTVGASRLHLPHRLALGAAVGIALLKAGLVGAFFMHLKSEQKLVYALLSFTALFCLLLLFLPRWTSPGGLVAHY